MTRRREAPVGECRLLEVPFRFEEYAEKLGAALTRNRGEDEQVEVRHLHQRLSLLLMRGNASLLVNRFPEGDTVDAMVDGIE